MLERHHEFVSESSICRMLQVGRVLCRCSPFTFCVRRWSAPLSACIPKTSTRILIKWPRISCKSQRTALISSSLLMSPCSTNVVRCGEFVCFWLKLTFGWSAQKGEASAENDCECEQFTSTARSTRCSVSPRPTPLLNAACCAGAMGWEGVISYYAFQGSCNGDVMAWWAQSMLVSVIDLLSAQAGLVAASASRHARASHYPRQLQLTL